VPILSPCHTWRSQMSKVNSGVTGPNFMKFSHTIEASFMLLTRKLRLWYPIPFRNGRAISAVGVGNVAPFLSLKWLPWQRPLRNWKKWTGLTTFTQMPSIWWKDRENWSSRSWDSFAQFKKRKKLTQAKYITRSAGLPSGLNKSKENHTQCSWGAHLPT